MIQFDDFQYIKLTQHAKFAPIFTPLMLNRNASVLLSGKSKNNNKMKSVFTFVLLISFIAFSGAALTNGGTWLSGNGKASWYGDKFHGKKTASGDKYDMHELTAAHKTLPFGTKVKITNQNNGKSVVVEVNDRGPFVKSRVFDLSKAAFAEIGNIDQGVMHIDYEIMN